MTPRQFYKTYDRDRVSAVCSSAGTNFDNFKLIAIAKGSCGKKLAERLAAASNGEMSELEILYPERYDIEAPLQTTSNNC